MQNIIDKEVKDYLPHFRNEAGTYRIGAAGISKKMSIFPSSKSRYAFLMSLGKALTEFKEDHEKSCTTPHCPTSANCETGMDIIEEQLEILDYHPDIPKKDEFSFKEQVDVSNKLDDILTRLENLGYGQEIIFNEIDEMRTHMGLGKSNWFKLLKGKLVDISLAFAVEQSVLADAYKDLAKAAHNSSEIFLR